MRHKTSKPTDSWASLLGSALKEQSRQPTGPGWQRLAEIRKETGIGRKKLGELLRQLIDSGKAEFFEGTVVNATGRAVRATWYRQLST